MKEIYKSIHIFMEYYISKNHSGLAGTDPVLTPTATVIKFEIGYRIGIRNSIVTGRVTISQSASRCELVFRSISSDSGVVHDSIEEVIDLIVFDTHRVETDLIPVEMVGSDEHARVFGS